MAIGPSVDADQKGESQVAGTARGEEAQAISTQREGRDAHSRLPEPGRPGHPELSLLQLYDLRQDLKLTVPRFHQLEIALDPDI